MHLSSGVRYGLIAFVMGATAVAWTLASQSKAPPAAPPGGRIAGAARDSFACLGRIVPEDGLFRLSARSLSGQPAIVATLFVKEGDRVKRGQLVAVLNSREQLEAAWRTADARGRVASTRLAQVRAGAKPADLQAQRADIARIEAERTNADRDLRRFEDLFKEGIISASDLDAHRVRATSIAQLLAQATERLKGLAEVRDVDVAMADAELQAALRAAAQAQAEYEQSQIRSPVDGHVITIHAWPGEEVREAGIMEIGQTDHMFAIAEVDESDLPFLKVGQRATVSSSALSEKLAGVVEYVALEVRKNDQNNIDPVAPSDARVVEAKIRLDDPAKASRLINAQVTVLIAR